MADLFVYTERPFDEKFWFAKLAKEAGITIATTTLDPTPETVHLAEGCPCVSILTTPVNAETMKLFAKAGVRVVSTRTIGFDHVDTETAREVGIHVANASYPPNSVAEYALMMMLVTLRKTKFLHMKNSMHDFSLNGNMGTTLYNKTVGVVGTGRIGARVIDLLSGFGCKILAFDKYPKESLKDRVTYVTFEELLANSDLITLHAPLAKEDRHMFDDAAFAKMRDGAYIINTARGGLIDSEALIRALKSGKIAGAGIDVTEKETGYVDLKTKVIDDDAVAILRSFPNVTVTSHMAFYTDEAVSNMVRASVESAVFLKEAKVDPRRVA